MKYLRYLTVLLISLCIALSSCAAEEGKAEESKVEESEALESKVEESTQVSSEVDTASTGSETTEEKVPTDFLLASITVKMSFGTTKSEFQYDEYGRVIVFTSYSDDKPYTQQETTYDENGFMIKQETYRFDASGNRKADTIRTFVNSDSGNPLQENRTLNGVASVITYTYNEQDRVVLYEHKDETGELLQKRQYVYTDDFGSYRVTEFDGRVNEYVYDANGNELLYRFTNADGDIQHSIENEYDSHNNVIKTVSAEGVFEFTNVYDGDRLLSIESVSDGELVQKTTYEYDAYGNCVKKTETNATGTVTAAYVYAWTPVYGD